MIKYHLAIVVVITIILIFLFPEKCGPIVAIAILSLFIYSEICGSDEATISYNTSNKVQGGGWFTDLFAKNVSKPLDIVSWNILGADEELKLLNNPQELTSKVSELMNNRNSHILERIQKLANSNHMIIALQGVSSYILKWIRNKIPKKYNIVSVQKTYAYFSNAIKNIKIQNVGNVFIYDSTIIIPKSFTEIFGFNSNVIFVGVFSYNQSEIGIANLNFDEHPQHGVIPADITNINKYFDRLSITNRIILGSIGEQNQKFIDYLNNDPSFKYYGLINYCPPYHTKFSQAVSDGRWLKKWSVSDCIITNMKLLKTLLSPNNGLNGIEVPYRETSSNINIFPSNHAILHYTLDFRPKTLSEPQIVKVSPTPQLELSPVPSPIPAKTQYSPIPAKTQYSPIPIPAKPQYSPIPIPAKPQYSPIPMPAQSPQTQEISGSRTLKNINAQMLNTQQRATGIQSELTQNFDSVKRFVNQGTLTKNNAVSYIESKLIPESSTFNQLIEELIDFSRKIDEDISKGAFSDVKSGPYGDPSVILEFNDIKKHNMQLKLTHNMSDNKIRTFLQSLKT